MAKEQLHTWGRYVLLAVVIIFGTGGWVVNVQSNTKDIVKLQGKTEILVEDVHRIELNAKDIQALAETAVRNAQESKEMFGKVMQHLERKAIIDTEMQVAMGKIQVKVDTLTKGE